MSFSDERDYEEESYNRALMEEEEEERETMIVRNGTTYCEDGQARSVKLLGFIQAYYAPTGKEQRKCTTLFNQMGLDGLTGDEIEKRFIDFLQEGVVKGNWFWDTMD